LERLARLHHFHFLETFGDKNRHLLSSDHQHLLRILKLRKGRTSMRCSWNCVRRTDLRYSVGLSLGKPSATRPYVVEAMSVLKEKCCFTACASRNARGVAPDSYRPPAPASPNMTSTARTAQSTA